MNKGKTYCLKQQVIPSKDHYFPVQDRDGRKNRYMSGKYGNPEIYETIPHTYKNIATLFLEGSSSICNEPVESSSPNDYRSNSK